MKEKASEKQGISAITIRSTAQLGNAIRRLRKIQNISQTELAQKSGVTQATISRLEKGTQKAEAGTLLLVLAALQADMTISLRPQVDPQEELEALF
jgi:transcriptional regulator with XRE-family HTH domain